MQGRELGCKVAYLMPAEGLEPREARPKLLQSTKSRSALLDANGLPRNPEVHCPTELG